MNDLRKAYAELSKRNKKLLEQVYKLEKELALYQLTYNKQRKAIDVVRHDLELHPLTEE